MKFKTHAVFGILCALFTFRYFTSTLDQKIIFTLLVFLGAVFPDIDIHNSWINRKLMLSKLIAAITRHRGLFHSLFMAIPLSYLFYLIKPFWGIGFLIGYLSHLIIDGLNHMGVNLFHPIQKFHLSGFIEVGSAGEKILFIALLIITILKIKFLVF